MTIELQDKLYTSTQVADVLGVSLRTLYRYMEDGRIKSMRTASGRHRFTKDQIVDFLNAGNFDEFPEGDFVAPKPEFTNEAPRANEFAPRPSVPQNDYSPSYNTQEQGNSFYRNTPQVDNRSDIGMPNSFVGGAQRGNEYQQPAYDRYAPVSEYDDMLGSVPPTRPQSQYNDSFGRPESSVEPKKDIYSSIDDFDFTSIRTNKTVIESEDRNKPVDDDLDSYDSFEFREKETKYGADNVEPRYDNFDQPKPRADVSSRFEYGREENRYEAPARPQVYTPSYDSGFRPQAEPRTPEYGSSRQGISDNKPSRPEDKELFDLSYPSLNIRYYKSEFSDLIDLARKIKETGKSRDLEYAFTLFAGLSLHFLIKPFTVLHFYANPEDMQIWKEDLRLIPANRREDANIGVIVNTDIVFVPTKDIAGFKVVEDKVLLRDLSESKEEDLVKQFRQHLMSI